MASVALLYSLAQDGELPSNFKLLNRQGVPWVPLIAAVVLPVIVLESTRGLEALASLYAIGVVGAIGLNIGSCSLNRSLPMKPWQRGVMMATAFLMVAIWLTIAVTKPQALVFAFVMCGAGLAMREMTRVKAPLEAVVPVPGPRLQEEPAIAEEGAEETGRILVAARGLTAAARFALEEAQLRSARLYFLFVREVQVATDVSGNLEDDKEANYPLRSRRLRLRPLDPAFDLKEEQFGRRGCLWFGYPTTTKRISSGRECETCWTVSPRRRLTSTFLREPPSTTRSAPSVAAISVIMSEARLETQ
ncbi:MAG: amino acid permease [Verrucomicrobia bacterium]|nr:amino acid permease [Verrucomicrobiota bacterium]